MLSPRMIVMDDEESYPASDRLLIKTYILLARLPLIRQILIWVGPAFEMILRKSPYSMESKGVDQT